MLRKCVFFLFLLVSVGALGLGENYTFYIVSHGGPSDPFWGKVIKGMQAAEEFINASTEDSVRVIYSGPPIYSVEAFVEMLNAAIATRPDGIAATMTNPEAVDEPMRRAISLGIPIIAINTPDTRPREQRVPYLFFIGADQYLAGVRAAERVLSVHTPTRAVVAIHEVGHVGFENRAQGFIDTMATAGVPVEKLATGLDPTQAVELLRGYFTRHADTDTIFTVGTLVSTWVIQFLHEQDLAGKVVHAAHDVHPVILNAIREGTTLLTISQRQYFQGYLAVFYLYWYQKFGFFPASDVLTGPSIIDRTNVDMVEQSELYW